MAIVTWNPADKHSTVTLSNGNLTATISGTGGIPRTTVGKSTGKWYWEFRVVTMRSCTVGCVTGSFPLTGDTSTALGYANQGAFAWYGGGSQSATMNGTGYIESVGAFVAGDYIGFALDLDSTTKTIKYFKNGVQMSTAIAITFDTRPLYPSFQCADTANGAMTANFGATSFAYSVPSGYLAYNVDEPTLLERTLTKRTSLIDLTVGDYIECEYTATSGVAGTFANLGSATKAVIPTTGTETPDGKFYFICVERKAGKGGLCIADRGIQGSIHWDTLNTAGLIEGKLVYQYAAPKMTSVTAPRGVVSSSGILNSSWEAWQAFNKLGNMGWIGTISNGGFLQYAFDDLDLKVIKSYSLQNITGGNNVRYPRAWTLKASNTGAFTGEEVILDTRSSQVFTDAETKTYSISSNTTIYKYLRVVVSNSGNYEPGIARIEFYPEISNVLVRSLSGGVGYADVLSLVPTMTSDTSPSGIVTYSDQYQSTSPYCAWCAFDGVWTGENGWVTQDAGTTHWLAYEFPTNTLVDMYTIYSYTNVTSYFFKTWKFQGSTNGSTWVDLDSKVNYSFAIDTAYPFYIDNTVAYKHYRIYITETSVANQRMVLTGFKLQRRATSSFSSTSKGYGAFPSSNEWDYYIGTSTLGGKITAGDDAIWNWVNVYSWVKETPSVSIDVNTKRVIRGGSSGALYWGKIPSTTVNTIWDFRPVLEFSEDGTIFY